jgi:hypothetical protein
MADESGGIMIADTPVRELTNRGTLFNCESRESDGLPDVLDEAARATRLTLLAVKGLLVDAEYNVIEPADIRLLHECADAADLRALDARRFLEKLEAKAQTPAVHPPLGEPVTHGERGADCPVCGAAILLHNSKRGHGGNWEDTTTCDRCKTRMHSECYWGRVATLSEFQEYRRQIAGGPEDYCPGVLCPRCRPAAEGAQS